MNSFFVWTRALSIARKETRHVLRDPFTLGLALGLPLAMVVFFGLAIDFNAKDLKLTIYDRDQSRASRQVADAFQSSGYFRVKYGNLNVNPTNDLDAERAKAVLIIEPEFQQNLGAGRPTRAQLLVDGADNSTVGMILGYVAGIQQSAAEKFTGQKVVQPITLKTRFLFNPELNTQWFIVPGLAATVMAILAILLTALTVAREWENGSMELLLSTPVKPLEIIAGKIAPYLVIGLLAQATVYVLARVGFGVPFEGSHILLLFGSLLFLAAYFAQGILISVTARQQQIAMQLAMLTGMLPTMLLSGFVFPVESMPPFFQYLSMIMPARWYMEILRSLFLRGADLVQLAIPFGALALISVIMVTAATKRFKTDVEP